ncbi:MAG: hypothetical protein ACRC1H_14690, partial [Caldilineaceae bacterium]
LSVNVEQVRWLHPIFVALALLGAGMMMRSRQALAAGGWVVPAWLLLPVVLVLAGNAIMPLYMNARHLSLLAPAWLLLVATGLAALGAYRRWLAVPFALVILGGILFSTWNHHTQEQYAKDDFRSLGAYLGPRVIPGDLIIYYPPFAWRIFDYYLPMQRVYEAMENGAPIAVHGAPLLDPSQETFGWLDEATAAARRTWVVKSGTYPFLDEEGAVESWLRDNRVQVRDVEFFSLSSLRAQLYLPRAPVDETASRAVPNATDAEFETGIQLVGIDPGWSPAPEAAGGSWGLPLPVTLYWQVAERPERKIKYLLRLEQVAADGAVTPLGQVEREPFEGDIGTDLWDPGKTIIELSELPWSPPADSGTEGALRFTLLL